MNIVLQMAMFDRSIVHKFLNDTGFGLPFLLPDHNLLSIMENLGVGWYPNHRVFLSNSYPLVWDDVSVCAFRDWCTIASNRDWPNGVEMLDDLNSLFALVSSLLLHRASVGNRYAHLFRLFNCVDKLCRIWSQRLRFKVFNKEVCCHHQIPLRDCTCDRVSQGVVCPLTQIHAQTILALTDHLRAWIYTYKIFISNFHRDQRLKFFFESIRGAYAQNTFQGYYLDHNTDKDTVYFWMGLHSTFHLIGSTTRSSIQRAWEHRRDVLGMNKRKWQPAYDCWKFLKQDDFICIPLLKFASGISKIEIQSLELHLIKTFQPTLNSPWANQYLLKWNRELRSTLTNKSAAQNKPMRHRRSPPTPPFKDMCWKLKPMENVQYVKTVWRRLLPGTPPTRARVVCTTTIPRIIDSLVVLYRNNNLQNRSDSLCREMEFMMMALSVIIIQKICVRICLDYAQRIALPIIQFIRQATRTKEVRPRIHLVRLPVPYRMDRDFRVAVRHCINACAPSLPEGLICIVTLAWSGNPKVVDTLTNVKTWERQYLTEVPCTCELLRGLGFPQPNRAFHLCSTLRESSLRFVLGEIWGSGQLAYQFPTHVCIRRISQLVAGKSNMRRYRVLRHFFYSVFTSLTPLYLLRSSPIPPRKFLTPGVPAHNDVAFIRTVLNDIAVISVVDKRSCEVAVACPLGRSLASRKIMLSADYRISTTSPEETVVRFQRFWDLHLGAANPKLKHWFQKLLQKHEFGQGYQVPKFSNMQEKVRPLNSYYKHGFKCVFSFMCMAGLHLISRLKCPNLHCMNIKTIVHKFTTFNDEVLRRAVDPLQRWMGYHLYRFKRDIDNFYPRVPREIVAQAWLWLISRRDACPPRRPYVIVRRSRQFTKKRGNLGFLHDGPPFRCVNRIEDNTRFLLSSAPRDSVEVFNFPIISGSAVIDLDYSTASCYWASQLWLQVRGVPQGSPLAVLQAILCAVFMETSFLKQWRRHVRWKDIFWEGFRWIDDIYIVVFVHPLDIAAFEGWFLASLGGCFQPLQFKVEDPSTFVGLEISINGNLTGASDWALSTTAYNPNLPTLLAVKSRKRFLAKDYWPRLQPWITARPFSSKVGVLRGMLCRSMDCATNNYVLQRSIFHLCTEWHINGVPNWIITKVLRETGLRTFPWLPPPLPEP